MYKCLEQRLVGQSDLQPVLPVIAISALFTFA
jgi:hypothetical protein